MKAIIEKMLECLLAFLPFLSKRSKKKVEKMKEFSEPVSYTHLTLPTNREV